ncbi:MAG: formylglycine-generating enzyme family protein [Nitrosomonas sp.]|nr:MAG: formylglycine-generating enzyme family protein [Nitrosomonas sp.]
MNRTTISAFASPVHLQFCQSWMIHGSSRRAAGAHVSYLPAVQFQQPKKALYSAGSISKLRTKYCRFHWLAIFLFLTSFPLQASENPLASENNNRAAQSPQSQQQPQQSNLESPLQPISIPPLGKPDEAAQAVTKRLAATCQTEGQVGPTMVIIPPGHFQMGLDSDALDRFLIKGIIDGNRVTIPKPFALSRCEVTVGQFRQFVQETRYQTTAETDDKGCYGWDAAQKKVIQHPNFNWQNPGFSQTDHHPVVCISWEDTQHYLAWLSQRTGARYRLPSEAEWEYAARGRTNTTHFYQPDQQCAYANGAGQETKAIAGSGWVLAECTDPFVYTAPVASFMENPFGLFDMAGNAWEWTQDCWHDDYTGAPTDGSAWLEKNGGDWVGKNYVDADSVGIEKNYGYGDCTRRVVRGGSWLYDPLYLRSANRGGDIADVSGDIIGFRVARDF